MNVSSKQHHWLGQGLQNKPLLCTPASTVQQAAAALFQLQLAWLRALRGSAIYQMLFDCRPFSIVCLGVLR